MVPILYDYYNLTANKTLRALIFILYEQGFGFSST